MYSACTCITHAQYLESLQWKLYLLNSVEQSQEGALNRGRLAEATRSTCIYCTLYVSYSRQNQKDGGGEGREGRGGTEGYLLKGLACFSADDRLLALLLQ